MIKKHWGLGIALTLTACEVAEHRRYHDTSLKLQQADYEKLTKPPAKKKIPPPFCTKPSIPTAPFLSPGMTQKVSLTCQESTSLKSILVELGRQTGVGIALSPHINTQPGITYSTYHTPLISVIQDICNLTHYRFQVQDNRILIEPDDPYLVTYDIEFLNQIRKNENRIAVATNVFSSVDAKNGPENGSDSILSGNTQMDFWTELEQNLKMLLGAPGSYTLHKQGGLVMISGTSRQHEKVREYLQKLKRAINAQVIIEAKIIEVTLNNEFKSGINWRQLGGALRLAAPLGGISSPQYPTRDVFTFSIEDEDFSAVLNLVKKFGTVRTLSNPRLTVMNNQPAMLKVATNEVFFHLEFDRYFQADGKPDVENVSSDPLTIPIGLVMIVQPSINLQTGEITLALRPSISRVQREVEDPAVAMKSNQSVKSTIPVVQVREIDSVLKIKSGQVVVMGGLMEDCARFDTASVPDLESIPFFGEFVKGKSDEQHLVELVIFLTAHIAEDPYIDAADERLYNCYVEDPRPL